MRIEVEKKSTQISFLCESSGGNEGRAFYGSAQ